MKVLLCATNSLNRKSQEKKITNQNKWKIQAFEKGST